MNIQNLLFQKALPASLLAGAALVLATGAAKAPAPEDGELELEEAHIFWEYNDSGNDLGVHVFLDGEDWKTLCIFKPNGQKIFEVKGKGPYALFGMTELFFEGAEPSLNEVPLAQLLAMFPEGEYEFEGKTVDGEEIEGEADFSHAIPDGPVVHVQVGANDFLRISWDDVTGPPPGFPNKPINIVGYQILVDDFDVILPGTANSVTVSPELVASLAPGQHDFEVLAIEASGNKSITEGVFVK